VLLGVNMQTSFMHPPFGFALFYLRSVAPTKDYLDRVSKKIIKGITTGQIYWGAVPFVIIQVIMVSLVIAFPQMVMVYKAGEKKLDLKQIQIVVPDEQPGGGPSDKSQPSAGRQQQDDAEKALEKAFGGSETPAAPETKGDAPATPETKGDAPATPEGKGAAPAAGDAIVVPEDDSKALERALREQMPDAGKEAPASK